MPYDDNGSWYEDVGEIDQGPPLTRPDNYTRDPRGGNWNLADNDWIDRYPGSVQDVIRRNWNANSGVQPDAPAATPATAPGGTTNAFFDAAGTFNGDYEGYFRSLFPGQTTLTGAQLKAKEADLKKAGMNVVTSASGNTAWVNYPGSGGDVDVIGDYGTGNRLQWLLPGQGGGAAGAGLGADTLGSLLQPFTGTAPGLGLPDAFTYPDFALPSGADVLADDPGYSFRVGQGERALMQNRAAAGVAHTGGTLKDLLNYGQNAASQEFDNAVNRRLTTYQTNRGNRAGIYDMDVNRRTALYNAAYKNYLDSYTQFRTRQQDTNQYLTEQQRIGLDANR